MPATAEEMDSLARAFERAHPPIARALAELLLQGNVVLEDHDLLDGPIGDAFQKFVLTTAMREGGIGKQTISETLEDLNRLRTTIGELDQLP